MGEGGHATDLKYSTAFGSKGQIIDNFDTVQRPTVMDKIPGTIVLLGLFEKQRFLQFPDWEKMVSL